jgi:uncharacterized protein
MAEIGQQGGASVSRDRRHMAEIGRHGGAAVSRDRAHMVEIGRQGGALRGGDPEEAAGPVDEPAAPPPP